MRCQHQHCAQTLPLITFMAASLALLTGCDKGTGSQSAPAASSAREAPATAPATQPIVMQTYDPAADPSFGLPVQLQDPEVKAYSARLDHLLKAYPETLGRLGSFEGDYRMLFADDVRALFHDRISSGKGFKDRQLPVDWSNHSADTDEGPAALLLQAVNIAGTLLPAVAVENRAKAIETRLIGGRVLAGDIRFIDTIQYAVDKINAQLDAREKVLTDLLTRYNREFPDNQLDYTPLSFHPAHLSEEARRKLIGEVKKIVALDANLVRDSGSYYKRRARFERSFKAIANAEGNLKNKDLTKKAVIAAAFKVPVYDELWDDLDRKFMRYQKWLGEFLTVLVQEPEKVSLEDVDREARAQRWTMTMIAVIQRGEENLDELRDLLSKEGCPLAWDAIPHSFSGEGGSWLARTQSEWGGPFGPDDLNDGWDATLQTKADEIRDRLSIADKDPSLLEVCINGIPEDAKKMHPTWRDEIHRRIFASTMPVYDSGQPLKGTSQPFTFAHFKLSKDFDVPRIYRDFQPHEKGHMWAIPCSIEVPGEVACIVAKVNLQGSNDSKTITIDLRSSASGKTLLDKPMQCERINGTLRCFWGGDPKRGTWKIADNNYPQHNHFDIAKEAILKGLIVVGDADHDYTLREVELVVTYTPRNLEASQ